MNSSSFIKNDASSSSSSSSSSLPSCSLKKTKLSDILVNAVFQALKTGKNVILTGHSLGAALAHLLALDLLINKNMRHNSSLKISKKRNQRLANKNSKLLKKLFLFSFGEPEFADEIFMHSVYNQSSEVLDFLKKRYVKLVSLTKSPSCKKDIVTRITSKIENYVGAFSGRKKIGNNIDKYHLNVINSTESYKSLFSIIKNKSSVKNKKSKTSVTIGGIVNDTTVYVCSGSANSSLEAHGIQHYLRGISYDSRVSDAVKFKNVTYSSNINYQIASSVNLIPYDGCFYTNDLGYSYYIC